jgi:hypothetical protein
MNKSSTEDGHQLLRNFQTMVAEHRIPLDELLCRWFYGQFWPGEVGNHCFCLCY